MADKLNCSVKYLLGRTEIPSFELNDERPSFIDRLTFLEEKHKITDYYVAKKLHVSTNYITNWRKNNYTPSLDTLIILSEIFKVSLDYLLGRTDDDSPFIANSDWY